MYWFSFSLMANVWICQLHGIYSIKVQVRPLHDEVHAVNSIMSRGVSNLYRNKHGLHGQSNVHQKILYFPYAEKAMMY